MKRADAGKSHNNTQRYQDKLSRRMLRSCGYRAVRTVEDDGTYKVKYFRRNSFHFILEDTFCTQVAARKGVVE